MVVLSAEAGLEIDADHSNDDYNKNKNDNCLNNSKNIDNNCSKTNDHNNINQNSW